MGTPDLPASKSNSLFNGEQSATLPTFDLLIIGGGINGAAVARDAAGRGLSVCLVEQGDPGGATSWASSKLIHGGLRYLEQYAFRLVRESLSERAILLRIAPHLTRACRFVLPHVAGLRPAWLMRIGLWLYDNLGSLGPDIGAPTALPSTTSIRLDKSSRWAAPLKPSFQHGFLYFDVQVDDARLVILTLRDAEMRGAEIQVGSRFISAHREASGWVCTLQHGEETYHLRSRAIVNAAGPWVAEVAGTLPASRPTRAAVQLVRGSHIVVPRCYEGDHAYTLQNEDGRVLFLLPFHERWTLIGTTDVRTPIPTAAPEASDEEVIYLCAAANRYLAKSISPSDVVWRFAGLRPLYDDGKHNPSAVTRDYRLVLDRGEHNTLPFLSVYGGKLTTHRHLAEAVLDKLSPWFAHLGPTWTATTPLPGGDSDYTAATAEFFQQYAYLPAPIRQGLWARHGTLAFELLAKTGSIDDLGRDFGGGLTELEALHFIRHEWARTAADILWRRTKVGLFMTQAEQTEFVTWFATHTPVWVKRNTT